MAVTATSASAFTLSGPSLETPLAASNIEHVWWDRWGNWHPNRPYWGPGPAYAYGYGYGPPGYGWHHRHCWRGRWGRLHCDW
jgi:hypothetical protein